MASSDPYAVVAERLGGEMVRRWTLLGGVSASVEALELRRPGGDRERVVVRKHGAAKWKPLEEDVTAIEHGLLSALADAGLPVPRPLLLDVSGEVLDAPFLVMPFVDASDTPPSLPAGLERMAAFLARLHSLDVGSLVLPEALPRRDDPVQGILEHLPQGFDDLAEHLRKRVMAPRGGEDSIVHGDFWPGNILWQGDEIAAVIDWEDAAVGDPVADVAGCRVELLWKHGEEVMEAFTGFHATLRGEPDPERLALWELHVASGGLAFMDRWGLEAEAEARMRARTQGFLGRARRIVMGAGVT